MDVKRTCQNCGKKWPYPAALKKAWLGRSGQACPSCGETQYLSAHSRMRSGTYAVMVMVAILLVRVLVDLTTLESAFVAIGLFLIVFLIFPFTIELTGKDQRFVDMKRK